MRNCLLTLALVAALGGGAVAQPPVSPRAKQAIKDAANTKNDVNNQINNTNKATTPTAPPPASKPPKTSPPKTGATKTTAAPAAAPAGMTSAAHQAALAGNLDGLKACVGQDLTRLRARDDQGNTPLHLAAWKGHKDVVAYLLENKVEVMALDPMGVSPLHLAASNGHREVVVMLLDAGADPNAVTRDKGMSALHRAAGSGQAEVVRVLLERGARVDLPDRSGQLPLALAERYQQGEWQTVVELLKKQQP